MALSAKDAERVEGYLVLHNREMFENSFGVKDELTEEERTELEDLKAWLAETERTLTERLTSGPVVIS